MKNLKTYLKVGAVLLGFAGCTNEQDDIFGKSAAERMNEAIETIDSTLISSSNGWVMNYYPTNNSGGYTLLVKFNANRETTVAARHNLVNGEYTEGKSLYDVIGDNGPVLTFNTYNTVLHQFSNPVAPEGKGMEGDYEFIVKSCSDTLVSVEGKKSSAKIDMFPFPSNWQWSSYLEKVNKTDNQLFGGGGLVFITGRDTILLQNGASHVFDLKNNPFNDVTQIPFIVTINGIRFYEPFVITEKRQVQNFTLATDGTTLVAENDTKAIIAGAMGIGTYFVNSQFTYAFDTTRMSNHYLLPVRKLYQQMTEKYSGKRNVDYLALSYKEDFGNSLFLATKPTATTANFKLHYTLDKALQTVAISSESGAYDNNGEIFYTNVPAIDEVWKALEGNYTLNSSLSINEIKFTDNNNSERFFTVVRR